MLELLHFCLCSIGLPHTWCSWRRLPLQASHAADRQRGVHLHCMVWFQSVYDPVCCVVSRSVGSMVIHGSLSSSSLTVLPGFDLILVSPRHKTASPGTKPG
ncbi:rCG24948 [Rattus norvegicus]|uniref:RCG24948 n=1 Tax=Rattus norvegicus TaxID=10116 RepID=A6KLU7_RAT|nr:rCG24948 [Rattus norvegicus]